MKDVIIDLLLMVIAASSFLVSYGFCNGTFIGTMLAMLMLLIATGSFILLCYRLNK